MIFDVEWSGEAQVTFAHILEELGLQWTTKEIEKFISRTDYVINLIRRNPELYAYSKKGEVHRAVISRQTKFVLHAGKK